MDNLEVKTVLKLFRNVMKLMNVNVFDGLYSPKKTIEMIESIEGNVEHTSVRNALCNNDANR